MTLFNLKMKNRFRDEEVPVVKTLHDYQAGNTGNLSLLSKIRQVFRDLIFKIS